MITPEEIKNKIEEGISGSEVSVVPVRQDSRHFKAIVKSDKFKGKTLVEQHRMVYFALEEEFKKRLHSLSIETLEK